MIRVQKRPLVGEIGRLRNEEGNHEVDMFVPIASGRSPCYNQTK